MEFHNFFQNLKKIPGKIISSQRKPLRGASLKTENYKLSNRNSGKNLSICPSIKQQGAKEKGRESEDGIRVSISAQVRRYRRL